MPHAYPREVVRIVGPMIQSARLAAGHHFKNRHRNGPGPARNWISEIRRIDIAAGYSNAARQCGASVPHYRKGTAQ